MTKHVVTPNTFTKRGNSFNGKKFSGKIGYTGWIKELQQKHRISLTRLLKNVEKN